MKLAILTSHVIQYQTPLFKKLAADARVDLTVYFSWDFGAKKTYDDQFKRDIEWDIPLLDGYTHQFLKNYSPAPSSFYWWGEINPGIVRELFSKKYDAILIYGWTFVTDWLAFFVAIVTRTPILIHSENPLSQEIEKGRYKLFLKRIVLGGLFKFIKGALYIGEENKKFYEYYGVSARKLFFTPYAVDNKRLGESFEGKGKVENGKSVRQQLKIADDAVAILFVGKLMSKKRPMDLLTAFGRITNNELRITKPHLIFVGDGELRVELEVYAMGHNLSDRVHFVGFKNQKTELLEYYAAADMLVLPSGSGETWGLVVNEAMNFGVPVIVSDVVGCGPDLVKEGENGFIFPCGNVEALAEKLKALVEDKNLRARFGKKSLEIISHYTHERDISGIVSAIGDCHSRAGGNPVR